MRPDALVRNADGSWDLYEVKSSTKLKDVHVSDVAVQLWVLEGAGLRIRHVYLMHLDNTYGYAGDAYDLARLFAAEDVTAVARAFLPAVPDLVSEMLDTIDGTGTADAHRQALRQALHLRVLRLLSREPPGAARHLPAAHQRRDPRRAARRRHPRDRRRPAALPRPHRAAAGGVRARALAARRASTRPRRVCSARLVWPIHFLDFETMMPALPLYPGTRPYQQVPFQWSDHVLHADGTVLHHEFLHEGAGRPASGLRREPAADARSSGERRRVLAASRARACANSPRRSRISRSRSRACGAASSTSRRSCAAACTTPTVSATRASRSCCPRSSTR